MQEEAAPLQKKMEAELLQKRKDATELLKKKKVALLQKKKEAELLQKKKDTTEVLKKKEAEILQKKKEAELLQKKKDATELFQQKEAPLLKKKKDATELFQQKEATLLQKKKEAELLQKKKDARLLKKKEVAVTQKIHQQGREVILYNVYRDHGSPVAKATILSIDRRKVVGGKELGPEYCEVVVNYIIKRDVVLPRGVGNITTMAQAQGRSIAWPYKHLEVDCKLMQDQPHSYKQLELRRRFRKDLQVARGLTISTSC